MSFATKLKKLREEKRLTQQELADMVDVSLKTISRYELGLSKPRYRKTYDLLAKSLDTSHDYLVTDEEDFVLTARENYGLKAGVEARELVDGVVGLMAGGEIPEEDKKAILDAISEAYYIARQENKKHGRLKDK
ncbi:helix-turn-helix domain-containing protein [Anaerococcus sp. NML200574]|uniref:helix-turn-helix domain-containing protein n=1 Tax=unclassified Anaerococcus TaxID=2614126 RepID=UPI000D0B1F1E|nr:MULTISPECIES: helix-turn-helix transcriptional regulator [unclassified Anaerococcus]MCW6679542.1 helix-turn-helix domain-containing protein [Anaerococcus sp. NML200574]MCW6701491.1 helix-turn-helix domain-containing protein [Anaerococcus sp. NML200537]